MSERIKKGNLSGNPKPIGGAGQGWCYEERSGLAVYHKDNGRLGTIRLSTIKAYLKRREAMK